MITENKNGRVTQIFTVQFNQSIKGEGSSELKKDQLSDQAISKGADIKVVSSTTSTDASTTPNKYY